jgi:Domain of unknown function (DUF1877)
MSMIGEYARVTPAELERAIGDPQWALEHVQEVAEAEWDEGPGASGARCLDVDKAWDAIGFLLRRTGFPVELVHGEEPIPGADDWGYTPPRYLTPQQVATAAAALARTSGAALIDGVAPKELADAEVYPSIVWKRGESLDYVRQHYEALVPFFTQAARDGDAVLVWLA